MAIQMDALKESTCRPASGIRQFIYEYVGGSDPVEAARDNPEGKSLSEK